MHLLRRATLGATASSTSGPQPRATVERLLEPTSASPPDL